MEKLGRLPSEVDANLDEFLAAFLAWSVVEKAATEEAKARAGGQPMELVTPELLLQERGLG